MNKYKNLKDQKNYQNLLLDTYNKLNKKLLKNNLQLMN